MSEISKLNQSFIIKKIDTKTVNIQIFDNAGWHFNNILSPEEISLKLKTFAHSEFADKKFSSVNIIEKKINNQIDLFERNHKYQKVEVNEIFPEYIRNNMKKFKKFII